VTIRPWKDIDIGETFSTGYLGIDPQPYHLDRDAAERSIFGGLCASGWQATALMMRLLSDEMRAQQIALTGLSGVPSLRWRQPVFAGDSLRADITVTGRDKVSRLPGSGTLTLGVDVLNQASSAVMELTARVMVAHAASAAA